MVAAWGLGRGIEESRECVMSSFPVEGAYLPPTNMSYNLNS